MSCAFEVVELQRRHLDQMLALRQETQSLHHELLPEVFHAEASAAIASAELRSFLPSWNPFKSSHGTAIGCIANERVLGYLLYYASAHSGDATMKPFNAIVIHDIAVAKDQSGKRLARCLLGEIETRARQQGATRINACIWRGNARSQRLFEGNGFRAQSTWYVHELDDEPGSDGRE